MEKEAKQAVVTAIKLLAEKSTERNCTTAETAQVLTALAQCLDSLGRATGLGL